MSHSIAHPFPTTGTGAGRVSGIQRRCLGSRPKFSGVRMRMGMRSSPEHGRGGGCQHLAAIRGPGQVGDTATPKPLQLHTGLGGHVPHLEEGTRAMAPGLGSRERRFQVRVQSQSCLCRNTACAQPERPLVTPGVSPGGASPAWPCPPVTLRAAAPRWAPRPGW